MPTAPRDGATSSAAGVSITFAVGANAAAAPAPAAEADAEFAELGRVAAASSASRAGGAQQLMAEMAAVLEAPSGTVLEPELQSMAEPRDSDSDEFDADPQSPRSDPADFLRERLAGARAPRALFCPPAWSCRSAAAVTCSHLGDPSLSRRSATARRPRP